MIFLDLFLKMNFVSDPTSGQLVLMAMKASNHIDMLFCCEIWFRNLPRGEVISGDSTPRMFLAIPEVWQVSDMKSDFASVTCFSCSAFESISVVFSSLSICKFLMSSMPSVFSSPLAAVTIPSSATCKCGYWSIEESSAECWPEVCFCR